MTEKVLDRKTQNYWIGCLISHLSFTTSALLYEFPNGQLYVDTKEGIESTRRCIVIVMDRWGIWPERNCGISLSVTIQVPLYTLPVLLLFYTKDVDIRGMYCTPREGDLDDNWNVYGPTHSRWTIQDFNWLKGEWTFYKGCDLRPLLDWWERTSSRRSKMIVSLRICIILHFL